MLLLAVHQVHSLTQAKYEEVVRRLTDGKKSRPDSLSDFPFAGLLVMRPDRAKMASGSSMFGSRRRRLPAFAEVIAPIVEEVGIDDPPEFFPAHTFISR